MAGIRIGGSGVLVRVGVPYSYGPSNYNIEITDPSGGGAHTDVTAPGAASVQTPVMNHAGTLMTYLKLNAGDYNMRSVAPDGSGDTLVRSGSVRYSDWSPDDSQIVFTVYDTGDEDTVRIMDADGSNESVLYTAGSGLEVMRPCFNFDGTKIAFMEQTSGFTGKIRCMNADGSGAADVVTGIRYTPDNAFSWAYGSNVIAYGDGQTNGKFRKINSDGTGGTDLETQLNSLNAYGTRHMWAPDDSAIYPEIYQGSTRWKIYESPAAGGGGAALSPVFQVVDRPTFVLDGRVYGLTYIEPAPSSGTNFSSCALDGSDRRVEDTAPAADILLELFA